MSLLSSALSKYGGISFWNTPCYRHVFKLANLMVVIEDHIYKHKSNRKSYLDKHQFKYCTRLTTSVLTLWTQVRYQDGCPRFHRDLEFPNFDKYRKSEYRDVRKTTWGSGDGKPGYTYVITFFGFLGCAYAAKSHTTHYIMVMAAAADVLAVAVAEVDISKVAPGGCMIIKWRGKPIFIKNRSKADIELEAKTPLSSLRDPQTPEERTIKQEWLVVIGICTHLGCVPITNTGDYAGGFYCPCHGSHYDNVGRARKGPAPTNLEIPPYKFLSDTLVLIG